MVKLIPLGPANSHQENVRSEVLLLHRHSTETSLLEGKDRGAGEEQCKSSAGILQSGQSLSARGMVQVCSTLKEQSKCPPQLLKRDTAPSSPATTSSMLQGLLPTHCTPIPWSPTCQIKSSGMAASSNGDTERAKTEH